LCSCGYLLSHALLGLFLTQPEVLAQAEHLLHIMLWSLLIFGFQAIVGAIMRASGVLLVPTLIGMVLRKANPNVGATIELIGSLLGVVVILFLVVSWVPRNYQLLLSTPWPVFAAAIGLGLTGMLLGYWLSRLLKQDSNRSRTISLETGIQNGPLAVLMVTFRGVEVFRARYCSAL